VGLAWTGATNAKVSVYRKSYCGADSYELLAALPAGASSYTDTSAQSNWVYWYEITATDPADNSASDAIAVSAGSGAVGCSGGATPQSSGVTTSICSTVPPTPDGSTITGSDGMLPTGPVYNIPAGASGDTIQNTINAATVPSTVLFAAGTYNITSPIILKCGVTYTGPATNPATAEITTSTANIPLFKMTGGCTSGTTTIEYLHLDGAGMYFDANNYSNINILHNQVTSLVSGETCGAICEAGAYFDGYNGSKVSDITIEYNTFGDDNSCVAGIGEANNDGNCIGIIADTVSPMALVNFVVKHNTFYHLEEGIHFLPTPYNPGGPTAYCNNCDIEYNFFNQIHRIQVEFQIAVDGSPSIERYNVMTSPSNTNAADGMYAFSDACCSSGPTQGIAPNTYLLASSNIIYDPDPLTSSNGISWGFEAWGAGQYVNNLIQGYVCNGIDWGYGDPITVSNNTMQSSIMANGTPCPFYTPLSGAFIAQEFTGTSAPTISGNVTGATPAAVASVAPTISPSAGSQSFPLTVTLTDAGYTSGSVPLGNTGIWYTTDGSTPVPGSGTAQYLADGGTFVLAAPATVKAVGMWGAPPEPTSYPAGYGFVPSAVVAAAYSQ
jgi:hypothetical protein